jgi:hypothetical protein
MDEFSSATAEKVFAAFPEWRALARTEQAGDGSSFLVVEVAPPLEANVEHGLIIDTSNGEVTVGFDHYHSHFDQWVGDGEHFGTEAALQFVQQILEEREAVVSWWNNEQWRGSSRLAVGSSPEVPTWLSNYNRVRVRSWKGTFNADTGA